MRNLSRRNLLRGLKFGSPAESARAKTIDADATPALLADISGKCIALRGTVCRLCEEVCDDVAISFRLGLNGKSYPLINETRCTGCGDCIPNCPSHAITLQQPPERAETL